MKDNILDAVLWIAVILAIYSIGLFINHTLDIEGEQRELLKLQIEEKQLNIKQLKSGACINE